MIFVITLLLVGPKRLPEIARAFGEAIRAFQDSLKDLSSDEPKTSKDQDPS